MAQWPHRPFVAVDLETTGSSPWQDAIIEIGAARYEGGKVVAEWGTLVDPGRPIPAWITDLTGIDHDMVQGMPQIAQALEGLREFVGPDLLCAHNASFDIGFLEAVGWTPGHPSIDTLDLYRLMRPGQQSHGLATAAKELGADFRHHRATEDARVTAQLLGTLVAELFATDPGLLQYVGQLVDGVDTSLSTLLLSAARTAPPSVSVWQPHGPALVWPPSAQTAMPLDARLALAADGPLFERLGLEDRKSQRDLLELVDAVLVEGGVLVAEAPTGTGKSLAYLLPSAARALGDGRRVVISTGTKNLQEQLLQKDLPALLGATGWPARAQLLKGRQNYLCLWRYHGAVAQSLQELPGDERLELARMAFWLHQTETGDRAETKVGGDLWSRVEATADTCSGEQCPLYKQCYFFGSRRRAEAADLIVVNHALLLSDLKSQSAVLPRYDRLIIDEAHQLDSAATEHLGSELSSWEVRRLTGRVAGTPGSLLGASDPAADRARGAQRAAQHLFSQARGLVTGRRSARLTEELLAGEGGRRLVAAGEEFASQVMDLGSALDAAAQTRGEHLRVELMALAERCRSARGVIASLLTPGEDDVAWIEVGDRDEVALKLAPLYPGELLQEMLFSRVESVVLTSATLSVSGDFDFLLEAIGLKGDPRLHLAALPTPFFFRDQCALLVATDLPEPKDPDFDRQAGDLLMRALQLAGGRSLVLFTAHRQLRAFADRLRQPLADMGLKLLAQGLDGPRSRLVESLRQDPRAVVFGAQSFWEGIDVVGDALSLVVLVKLPFQPPDRPVVEARVAHLEREGHSAFYEFSLPDAALRLKQGFGRLIRSSTDQGAVLVLDRRLAVSRYGRYLLDALPDADRVIGESDEVLSALARWLR